MNRTMLLETTNAWGIQLSEEQIAQFATLSQELKTWNQKFNLTAITSDDDITRRHFLESLRCALLWGDTPPSALADVGTGAGFPGFPLKIAFPEIHLTLIESVKKKTTFLHHIVTMFDLKHVDIVPDRAENIGKRAQHREHYDIVTARALAPMHILTEYCLPLVRVGGKLLAHKGVAIEEEIASAARALHILGGKVCAIESVIIPETTERTIVVIEKVAPTPSAYPRAVGVPKQKPI